MDLFKLLYVFVKVVLSLCLLPFAKQKPSWSSTKILKLVKDSSLNVGVEWVKVLNALSPSCLWQCSCIFCFFVSLYFCILYLCGHCAAYVALLLSTLPKCQPPSPGRLPKHSSAKRCYDDEGYYKNDDDDNDDDYKNDDENTKTCFWLLCCWCAPNQYFCYCVVSSVNLVASAKFEWTIWSSILFHIA